MKPSRIIPLFPFIVWSRTPQASAVFGHACSAPAHSRGLRALAVWAGVWLVFAGLSVPAQTYLIDFGGVITTGHGAAPNDPVNYWNNVTTTIGSTSTGVLTNLVTSLNHTSTISLAMVSRFNSNNEDGTQASTRYPASATRDSLFGNTGIHGGLTGIFPSFKLTGLDPATQYTFTFYASRAGVTDNRETGYTVTGGNSGFAALNPASNVDETATVAGITPDGAGEITIAIAPTANNNNAIKYTYLGVLQMDAVPPQTPLSFTLQPVSQRVVQLKSATFTCAVSGPPPYFVQWYENGSPVSEANGFSYTIPEAQLLMDGNQYSVTVSNLAYGVTSSNAVLTVLSDTNPPLLLKAASYDGTTVILTFNEPMDYGSVSDPAHYGLNGGAVQVWGAVLNPDNRSATLTLSDSISGSFTVVVNSVLDFAGNAIAANTTLDGKALAIEDQDFLFDFGASATATEIGPSPNDPDNAWNNVTGAGTSDTGEMLNLLSVHNVSTPIGLSMIRRFNGANTAGTMSSTVFPQNATRDSLFGNTEAFGTPALSNVFPSFKLTGLNPARQYNLTFFASRTSTADNRETGYTVEGANNGFAALDPGNNVNSVATVEAIAPTAAGEINVSIAPTARNNNANHFTYLGVMRLSPYVPPLQFLPPVIEGGKIKLQWTGTGKLERAPLVNGSWTPITPAPTSPFQEDLVPGENRFYRLQKP